MAADSMVTKRMTQVPEAQKLYKVPGLVGGVSVWGGGGPGADSPDVWLRSFVEEHGEEWGSVTEFAAGLGMAAAEYFGEVRLYRKRTAPEFLASLGFHVAGFEDGKLMFFNIHNNQGKARAKVRVNPAHGKVRSVVDEGGAFHVRNGDWEPFGEYFQKFTEFGEVYTQKSGEPFVIPYPPDKLSQWAKFYGFQVLLMSGIFQLSNLTPQIDRATIGGEVNVLMMEPDTVIGGMQKLVVSDRGLKLERVG